MQQFFPKLLLGNPNYKTNLSQALTETFEKLDNALIGISQAEGKFSTLLSGTTATVMVRRDDMIYVAHVGDSRAALCKIFVGKGTSDSMTQAEQLTRDHSPILPEEKARVESKNGEVRRLEAGSPFRVFAKSANYPGLAMSRALGDEIAKNFGVIAEPEILAHKICPDDLFVILCSDGVWEFLTNEEVVGFVHRFGKKKVKEAANMQAEKAFNIWLEREGGRSDDITCIVYYL